MGDKINGYHAPFLNGNVKYDEVTIPVPWGVISGKWWGPKDCQPVIAIHGWQDNAGSFDKLAPLITKRNYSILAIDLPGHGLSSKYHKGQFYYIFWDGIHLLRRIVKHFNWEKITIIGHSLGGAIAFLYAAAFPNDIVKYVSIDIASPAVRDPAKISKVLGDAVDKFLKYESFKEEDAQPMSYEDALDILYDAHKTSLTKESCKILMKRGTKSVNGGYIFVRDPRLKASALGMVSIEQTLEMAANIKCEVLNIRAVPGMVLDRPEYYDMVLNQIGKSAKRLERHQVTGTHHLHLNDPCSVSEIIADFLDS